MYTFSLVPDIPHPRQQGSQDYLDKCINSVEGKYGFDKDGKYDKYEEKGTDALRNKFEQSTGKNVPDKVRPTYYNFGVGVLFQNSC